MIDPTALHLLRPQWLWALLALPLLAWLWQRRGRAHMPWQDAVDPHLLPRLIETPASRRSRLHGAIAALGYVLAVLALAGPSWRQVEQPLSQGGTPLVVAVDLSSETLATDLPPSRLAHVRAKLAQLLQARSSAPVGLVAYADDAFTVAPLTDDAANVGLFLDALAPDVMPVDGRRTDRAIERAVELLRRAGYPQGEIVLLTGDAEASAREAAASAARAGYRVSVLGLGTDAGALVRMRDRAIRQVRLEDQALRALARAGDGRYAPLQSDPGDLRELGLLDAGASPGSESRASAGRVWQDEGYWLLPPLMLLALFALRRRAGVLLVLLCVGLPWSQAEASSWWQRPDQAAYERLLAGNEAYRRGDFDRAAALYRGITMADAHYNRGNALAKSGEYRDAIAAYDEALKLQPGMADAIANRRAVLAAMKRQPPPAPKSGKQQGGKGNSQSDRGAQQKDGEGQRKQPPQSSPESSQSQPQPQSGDAREQQRQADAAQRERVQRALQQRKPQRSGEPVPGKAETPAEREQRIANEAWLRRVPDDPGGLLRAKFRLEHQRRQEQTEPTP
ncbi:tetratricopeptide repeat protein [Lysobacter korlensis]|uniref:Tetratricopeptide repeat protein n=1 Tax=Lysobacter korlensis TaxID=553636 RepID=A0ABV6RJ48_9GAMM